LFFFGGGGGGGLLTIYLRKVGLTRSRPRVNPSAL